MAFAHPRGGNTSLETFQVCHLTDRRCWECHRHSWAAEGAVLFCSEFVREELLQKISCFGANFLFHIEQKECPRRGSSHFYSGKMKVSAISCCRRHRAGSACLFLSRNRSCCLICRTLPQSTWTLWPKGPEHLLHFHQQKSNELGTPTAKGQASPHNCPSHRGYWNPLGSSFESPDSSCLWLSFPISSWISPWWPHTLSGLSRIPAGLLLCMHTHPAESLFNQSPSLGFFWVVFTSVVREGNIWCHFTEDELSATQPQDAEQEKCSWLPPGDSQPCFATSSLNFPTGTHDLSTSPSWPAASFPQPLRCPLCTKAKNPVTMPSHLEYHKLWAHRSAQEPHLYWSFGWKSASHKQKFIALCCPQTATPAYTDTDEISNHNIRLPNPFPFQRKTSFW